jgi:hypothetical protein
VIHKIKFISLYLLAISGLITWLLFIFQYATSTERIIIYDCTIAEISPDFPQQVREDCRKLFLENNSKKSNNTMRT